MQITEPTILTGNNIEPDFDNPGGHQVTIEHGAIRWPLLEGVRMISSPSWLVTGESGFIHIGERPPQLYPYDKAIQIIEALRRGGDDASDAYEAIIDIFQAPGGDILMLTEFVSAYSTIATNNLTYSANLLKKLAVATQGQEWADSRTNLEIFTVAQTFINNKTKAQLMGLETELIKTVN